MDITLHKCTACSKMHWDRGNMLKHVASQACRGAHLVPVSGRVVVEDGQDQSQQERRNKPGPRPINIPELLRDRIPAFEAGDEARIDFVFAGIGDLADRLLDALPEHVPNLMFREIWSSVAPLKFQSIVLARGILHEVLGDNTVASTRKALSGGFMTQAFVREFAIYTVELAHHICKYSVKARRPEWAERASAQESRLEPFVDALRGVYSTIKEERPTPSSIVSMRHRTGLALRTLSESMATLMPRAYFISSASSSSVPGSDSGSDVP
jgi:hypothetical protein